MKKNKLAISMALAKPKVTPQPSARAALETVVEAWESLQGGTHYTPQVIEGWLINQMAPAINKARQVLKDGGTA